MQSLSLKSLLVSGLVLGAVVIGPNASADTGATGTVLR